MSIEEEFQRAAEFVRCGKNDDGSSLDNSVKLRFYGLYKQATVGDCNIAQPWAIQVEARAKWEAWKDCAGLTSVEAMKLYVEELRKQVPSFH